jgi:hypothetical protein
MYPDMSVARKQWLRRNNLVGNHSHRLESAGISLIKQVTMQLYGMRYRHPRLSIEGR